MTRVSLLALARPQRGEGSIEAGHTHDSVDDDVDGGMESRLDEHLGPGGISSRRLRLRQSNEVGPPLGGLRLELGSVTARRQGNQSKVIALTSQNRECAAANRAGRAEDCNAAHQRTPSAR
jgi:hypothetical protein